METIIPDTPPSKCKEVILYKSVDSNHADNKLIRRSRTRFVIHMNISLINWCSKNQTTIVCHQIYVVNMKAIYNTPQPESTLKKKCKAIAYHAIHESVAMRESLRRHIRSN